MTDLVSMLKVAVVVPLLVLGSAGATAQTRGQRDDGAELAKALEGKIAEKPRVCIPLDEARAAKTYNDAITYRVSRRLTYVNSAKGCNAFDPDPILITDLRGSQLCRGDIVQIVSRVGGLFGPVCILGDFTPYRTPR